jgi:hypothetical protein
MGKSTAIPVPYNNFGHYAIAAATGDITAGAATKEVFQFRWTSALALALITEIRITGMRASTAFTAASNLDIKATIARGFSAAGTGGTAQTLTGNNQKLRTNMGTTAVGEIRVATTAALGAGTKTFDSQDIGQILTHSSGGVGSATAIIGSIYLPTNILYKADVSSGEHPIVLAASEGFAVQVTVPAAGVWSIGIAVKWCETPLDRSDLSGY